MTEMQEGQGAAPPPPGGPEPPPGPAEPGRPGQPSGPPPGAGGALPTFSTKPSEEAFAGTASSDEKSTAVLAAVLAIFIWIISPLIFWLTKKEDSEYLNVTGKELLNFEISVLIYAAVCSALIPLFCIGAFLWPLLGLFHLVMLIIGAIKANEGIVYRYPLCLRLIK